MIFVQQLSLPRMRGDRPPPFDRYAIFPSFTPHARGSTPHATTCTLYKHVYPACAGIDLMGGGTVRLPSGLPRMRGDRPKPVYIRQRGELFTPHARGSTFSVNWDEKTITVYPACAGIDR